MNWSPFWMRNPVVDQGRVGHQTKHTACGQEDLANRTLDWKYQSPAEDSADAAPSAAPEFVASADSEPAAEPKPAPAPTPEPASAAPAPQEAGGMSGTTKLLIAVAVLVVLYWIIF